MAIGAGARRTPRTAKMNERPSVCERPPKSASTRAEWSLARPLVDAAKESTRRMSAAKKHHSVNAKVTPCALKGVLDVTEIVMMDTMPTRSSSMLCQRHAGAGERRTRTV